MLLLYILITLSPIFPTIHYLQDITIISAIDKIIYLSCSGQFDSASSVPVEAHEIALGILCRMEVARVAVCLHVLFGSLPDPSGAPPRRKQCQLGVPRAQVIIGAPYFPVGMARRA